MNVFIITFATLIKNKSRNKDYDEVLSKYSHIHVYHDPVSYTHLVSYAIRILCNMSPFVDYVRAEKGQAMPEELCLPEWTANDVQKQ